MPNVTRSAIRMKSGRNRYFLTVRWTCVISPDLSGLFWVCWEGTHLRRLVSIIYSRDAPHLEAPGLTYFVNHRFPPLHASQCRGTLTEKWNGDFCYLKDCKNQHLTFVSANLILRERATEGSLNGKITCPRLFLTVLQSNPLFFISQSRKIIHFLFLKTQRPIGIWNHLQGMNMTLGVFSLNLCALFQYWDGITKLYSLFSKQLKLIVTPPILTHPLQKKFNIMNWGFKYSKITIIEYPLEFYIIQSLEFA